MRELRSLVDWASDAALAIDERMRVVAWNARAASLLGYSRQEALNQPCSTILQAVHPDRAPLCSPKCEGKRCFERHVPFDVADCCLRHKDGRWVRATISTLVSPALRGGDTVARSLAIVLLRPQGEAPDAATAVDGRLRVFTLGSFALRASGRDLPTDRWYRRHALTLLKILVTHRREALHREHLIACLWPDADEQRGRKRLKVTTYFLREQLRAAGINGDIVRAGGPAYALDSELVCVDRDSFDKSYEEGRRFAQRDRREDALASLEQAARLYRGDYLPEDLYAEWCAEERERLRETYFDVLGHLIDIHLDRGDFEEAAVVCRRGLVHEPCREGFHRALMICLAQLGQRDRLIMQYERCRAVLKAELGVGPMPETERLFRELVNSTGARGPNGRRKAG